MDVAVRLSYTSVSSGTSRDVRDESKDSLAPGRPYVIEGVKRRNVRNVVHICYEELYRMSGLNRAQLFHHSNPLRAGILPFSRHSRTGHAYMPRVRCRPQAVQQAGVFSNSTSAFPPNGTIAIPPSRRSPFSRTSAAHAFLGRSAVRPALEAMARPYELILRTDPIRQPRRGVGPYPPPGTPHCILRDRRAAPLTKRLRSERNTLRWGVSALKRCR
ncbi:hypothetical protein BC628DRAFT_1192238 [Trametes gibbosa]|nr:hypothetical protein BC628DRAFT_1192238 [Trametes gibbosa]